jgi:antitoxin HigA-1
MMVSKPLLEPIPPGEILLEEFMTPMGISINWLARDIQVSPGRISAIVNGKRAITADRALGLGKYLRTSSDLWIGLQGEFGYQLPNGQSGLKSTGVFRRMSHDNA